MNFRNNLTTFSWKRGASLRDVQALLGHKSIATTARYTHIDSERLRTLVGNLRLDS
jgi:integrase/recombinase XerC